MGLQNTFLEPVFWFVLACRCVWNLTAWWSKEPPGLCPKDVCVPDGGPHSWEQRACGSPGWAGTAHLAFLGSLAVSRTARSFIKLRFQNRLCTDAEQPEERAELLPGTPPPRGGPLAVPHRPLDSVTVLSVHSSLVCEVTSPFGSSSHAAPATSFPVPALRGARRASVAAARPPARREAAAPSCRCGRHWIEQACGCRQTPGTFLAGALFGLEFPGPYQEPPLVTQPVPELTLTFTLRQGLAEHLKGKKMEALRVQMFMPCAFESLCL